jgi:hypothetical protein
MSGGMEDQDGCLWLVLVPQTDVARGAAAREGFAIVGVLPCAPRRGFREDAGFERAVTSLITAGKELAASMATPVVPLQ